MDDGSPIRYLFTFCILVALSAFFAATETAFACVNRIRMLSNAAGGDKRAERVLTVLDQFDKALTTVLIGNNIAHIACASTATLFATKLWGVDAVTATTLVTAFVMFLVAESLPKKLAKLGNEAFAMNVAGILLFLMRLIAPVAFLFSKLGDAVSRPFKHDQAEEPTVTEDELHDMLETAAEEGAIDEEKTELVQNALDFSGISARDILTPWAKVITVSTAMRPEEIAALIRKSNHSRLPVVDARGEVVGLLSIRKFLRAYLKHEGKLHPRSLMDAAVFIQPDMPIDDLLPFLSARRTQTAIVRAEGERLPLGIVTVEDILEELVGEIYDEDDSEVPV